MHQAKKKKNHASECSPRLHIPPLPLHGFFPPPPPKKKKLVVRVFLGVPSSIQRPLPIESPMLRLDVPHLCVYENASYQRFFSILIKVEQLSLPKRISEVTNVTFFAPPVSISIMLSNVLDVALPVTIRLTISLNERMSIRQSEVY